MHITELAQRQKRLVSDIEARLAADADASPPRARSCAPRCSACAPSSRRRSRRHSPRRRPSWRRTRRSGDARCTSSTSGCAGASASCWSASSARRSKRRSASRRDSRTCSAARSSSWSASSQRATVDVLRRGGAAVRGRRQVEPRRRGPAAVARARPRGRGVRARSRGRARRAARTCRRRRRAAARAPARGCDRALERQRDERLGALDARVVELEAEIRRRLEELGADAEAERAVIEARLQELVRRLDRRGCALRAADHGLQTILDKQSGEGFVVASTNHGAMSEMTEIAQPEISERSKVESWRLHVLIEAGYPLPLAERLATSEADLHLAVELVGTAARTRPPPRSCSSAVSRRAEYAGGREQGRAAPVRRPHGLLRAASTAASRSGSRSCRRSGSRAR